jgi:hypothetical protein
MVRTPWGAAVLLGTLLLPVGCSRVVSSLALKNTMIACAEGAIGEPDNSGIYHLSNQQLPDDLIRAAIRACVERHPGYKCVDAECEDVSEGFSLPISYALDAARKTLATNS